MKASCKALRTRHPCAHTNMCSSLTRAAHRPSASDMNVWKAPCGAPRSEETRRPVMMMRPRPAPAARPPEANRRARRSGARSSVRALTLVRRRHKIWGQARVHDPSVHQLARCSGASQPACGCTAAGARPVGTASPWRHGSYKISGVVVRALTLVRRDTAPTAALVVSSHSRRSRSCRRSGSWKAGRSLRAADAALSWKLQARSAR